MPKAYRSGILPPVTFLRWRYEVYHFGIIPVAAVLRVTRTLVLAQRKGHNDLPVGFTNRRESNGGVVVYIGDQPGFPVGHYGRGVAGCGLRRRSRKKEKK